MLKTKTIEAIYENGLLRPVEADFTLPEQSRVKITIEFDDLSTPKLLPFAGILSDEEANALQEIITNEFGSVDSNDW